MKLNDPALVGLLSALIGVLGTLGGVHLGARASRRAQRQLLLLTVRSEERRLRSDTYAEYLAALRRFRVFIMTEASGVTVIQAPDHPDGFVVLVEGASEYMDALQGAAAQVLLLAGPGSTVVTATIQLHKTMWELARARQSHPAGSLPGPLVKAARQAEEQFVRVAHADLDSHGLTDDAAA